jgi:hypothetical protein
LQQHTTTSGVMSDWRWHAGRWAEMDRVFTASGVRVRWYGGESGAVGSKDGKSLSPTAGWKAPDCYAGNWDRYLADILTADEWIANWNRYNGDRFLGFVLFTTGAGYTGWANFQIQADLWMKDHDANVHPALEKQVESTANRTTTFAWIDTALSLLAGVLAGLKHG